MGISVLLCSAPRTTAIVWEIKVVRCAFATASPWISQRSFASIQSLTLLSNEDKDLTDY